MRYKEGFLIQIIIYVSLWLWDEYVGFLMCIVMGAIMTGLLIFSWVVELIEKSKVPNAYFKWMALSIVPPLIVLLAFALLSKGDFYWLI